VDLPLAFGVGLAEARIHEEPKRGQQSQTPDSRCPAALSKLSDRQRGMRGVTHSF
jgi:hypothetical protein